MHLKQKTPCFGVLLVFTISITLASIAWCETTINPFRTPLSTTHNDGSKKLTTESLRRPTGGEIRHWSYFRSKPGEEESKNLYPPENLEDKDPSGMEAETRQDPDRRNNLRKLFFLELKPRFKRMETGDDWLFTSQSSTNANCSSGGVRHLFPGKFYITGQLEANIPQRGSQSDSISLVHSQGSQSGVRGEQQSILDESWQKLQPVVECAENGMTLTVRRRRAVQLVLDRVNDSSVPLFQLPLHCGYSVETTWGDLSLTAQYDACHVIQENDNYVLPLLWRGTPVKASCPVSQIKARAVEPSTVCCSTNGMTVKVQMLSEKEEPSINVRGEWTPLMSLAERCGYTLQKQDATITIVVPFISCGISVKDGKYTLSLQMEPKILTFACPISIFEGLSITHQHLADSPIHLTGKGAKPDVESLGSVPWVPPFYLAPPYYPHPTYGHGYAQPEGRDSSRPPTPSLTVEALPTAAYQTSYQELYLQKIPRGKQSESAKDLVLDYLEEKQNQEAPISELSGKQNVLVASSPSDGDSPHSQPPSHDFSPYYHYYHHPKIPLRSDPQSPGTGGSGLLPSASLSPQFQSFPLNEQQSESFSRVPPDQTLPAPSKLIPHISTVNAPYPPQFYPHHYFYYFPQISKGHAKKMGLIHSGFSSSSNVSSVDLRSSAVSPENNINLPEKEPKAEKTNNLSNVKSNLSEEKSLTSAVPPVLSKPPQRPNPVAVPPSENPSPPTPGFLYNANPYRYYYHPYYNQYLTYYKPAYMFSKDEAVSAAPSKNDSPQPQVSFPSVHRKSQSPASHTKSTHVQDQFSPYYSYYKPQAAKSNQLPLQPGNKHPKVSQFPSSFDYGRLQRSARTSETKYPSVPLPQYNPYYSPYSYATRQHPYGPNGPYFQQTSGNEAKEELDGNMKVHYKPNSNTPLFPPCGFGPASEIKCGGQLGCCLYDVHDGAVGPYFVFAMPGFVAESIVVPPNHSKNRNASCTPQRLTSDLDIYVVPLDGCGVNEHIFGPATIHLLEVQGVQSHQGASSTQKKSPLQLTVGCSSSPHSPGEVRFHAMDPPPQSQVQPTPSVVTVLLRLATDESFTRYYPGAHLPLSLLEGKPVYVELSLLGPSDTDLVLLVHSCLAYTLTPYISWINFYDGCPSRGFSELLHSPNIHNIWRIKIPTFPSLPLESLTYLAHEGFPLPQDPEVYFLCLSERCPAVDEDCRVSCVEGPSSSVR